MKKRFCKLMTMGITFGLIFSMSLTSYAYTVQSGDTLSKIAHDNHVTIDQLVEWNQIVNRDILKIGQNLKILGGGYGESSNSASSSVAAGESLAADDISILSKMFDATFYATANPDVAKACGTDSNALFKHFINYGLKELRQPNKDFNVAVYAAAYNDLSAAFGTDVISYYRHAYLCGMREGRNITTVEAMENAGLNPLLITGQTTVMDTNGRPQFKNFYQSDSKSFAVTGTETASHKSSSGSSAPSKKADPEPVPDPKPAFNDAAYQRDMKIWYDKCPDLKDYLEDGVYEKYEEEYNAWKAIEPTLAQIKQGRLFATEELAQAAYESEHAAWVENEPKLVDYATEAKLAEFTQDTKDWNDEKPKAEDYTFNKYASQDAADTAFNNDLSEWELHLDMWLTENNKNDYSVGYATTEAADSAYDKALFDFVVLLYNFDFTTQYDSKTKGTVAEQKLITATTEFENSQEWKDYLEALQAWTEAYEKEREEALKLYASQIDVWEKNYKNAHPKPGEPSGRPTKESIEATLVKGTDYEYETSVEASQAYQVAVRVYFTTAVLEPDAPKRNDFRVGKYATQQEADAAKLADREDYRQVEELPILSDYSYDPNAKYSSKGAAETAFNQDKSNWEKSEPKLENYADVASYKAAHDKWVTMEPKLDDGYYEVKTGANRGDGSFLAVSYVPNEDGPFYDTDFYLDDRHYPDAPTEEELLDELVNEWTVEMPTLDEEDWKPDGEEQYNENTEDWATHEPEKPQYEEGSDGDWEGCPDYEYVEPKMMK